MTIEEKKKIFDDTYAIICRKYKIAPVDAIKIFNCGLDPVTKEPRFINEVVEEEDFYNECLILFNRCFYGL